MSALKIKKGSNSHSAYNLRPNFSDVIERHTLAVLVENEPGVLARVRISLVGARTQPACWREFAVKAVVNRIGE